jgi:hypothetical protein
MADRVKRRVAAARLAVAFVAAGTIAGATAWASAGPPPTAQSSASDIFAKIGDIKSEQIEDHSLKYKDFAKGQVPSFKMYEKLNQSFFRYKKAESSYKAQIKGELGDLTDQVGKVKSDLVSGYIKTNDADARYLSKNTQVVFGDGSVFTATKSLAKGSALVTLADLAGLVKVEATDQQFKVTNLSSGPLTHTACGVGGAGGSLAPGASLTCSAGEAAQTVQFVNGDGRVVTVNFSDVALPSSAQATVQILVGL